MRKFAGFEITLIRSKYEQNLCQLYNAGKECEMG